MSRISSALASAFGADPVRIFILAEFQFDSGTVRLTTHTSNITWNGYTWTAAGGLLAFDFPEETGEVRATGGTITLSGLDTSTLAIADTEPYQGRPCALYVGAFDSDGTVVVDPDTAYRGFMDTMEPSDEAETATIALTIENRMAAADRANERRYTPEDQALRYDDDRGFDFVAGLQEKDIIWGGPG